MTRTFVILESMIRDLDPEHDFLKSFREQIKVNEFMDAFDMVLERAEEASDDEKREVCSCQ